MIIKLFVSQCSLLSYSICLRGCKICVVFVVELNLKVIPVKYGQELTHCILEGNICTKHVSTTTWKKTHIREMDKLKWWLLLSEFDSSLF